MNLRELSTEQKREVIKQQLKGNKFFDHLLALSGTQKQLDEQWEKKLSKSDRHEVRRTAII